MASQALGLHLPLIDDDNPMYCPDVSAQQYIASVRLFYASLEEECKSSTDQFPYFHKLRVAFDSDSDSDSEMLWDADARRQIISLGHADARAENGTYDTSVFEMGSLLDSPMTANAATVAMKDISNLNANSNTRGSKTTSNKRSNQSASDGIKKESSDSPDVRNLFDRPAKRVKRSSSEVIESFVLSARADGLKLYLDSNNLATTDTRDASRDEPHAYWPDSEIDLLHNTEMGPPIIEKKQCTCGALKHLQDELYGPEVGFQTPRSILRLLNKIQNQIPGIYMKALLRGLTTHQDIVNILSLKGHLNYNVLSLLRKARVFELNLTESINDADGLNLGGSDILKVFKTPNSFLHLQKLVLSDVPLADDDVLNFNELPGLEALYLDNTHVSDVAIMHLVPLKHTLTYLDLAWDDAITDDAIPSLCALRLLEILSLKGTNITMDGLRKLAWSVKEPDDRSISLVAPAMCEKYVYSMHKNYALLLSDTFANHPGFVCRLTPAEVKWNLEEHAKHNPNISTVGTKEDLEGRLKELLDRRQKDFAVRSFIVQT